MLHEGKVSFVSTQVEQTVQKIKDLHNKFSVSRKPYKVYGPQAAYLYEKQCSIWLFAHKQVKLPRHHK